MAAAEPSDGVRLLPAFDQYVLASGTNDPRLLDPARRGAVSRAAGWIAPVVLVGGRIGGTWEVSDGLVRVALFAETPAVDESGLLSEAAHLNPGVPLETSRV